MAKQNEKHNHTLQHIIIVFLVLIVLFVLGKHLIRQNKWSSYVVDSQKTVANYNNLNSVEDGNIIATTIVSVPADNPLIKQEKALQEYIQDLSQQTDRDIVVLDAGRKILADTFAANVGKVYNFDKGSEVAMTIGDGNPRYFLEKSTDYPEGVSQTVIPIKNSGGATIGALIISSSTVFNK